MLNFKPIEKKFDENALKPEGKYTVKIENIETTKTPKGKKGLQFKLRVVSKPYTNALIWHTVYKATNLTSPDVFQEYNMNNIFPIATAAKLPEKDYNNLQELLDDLIGKTVIVELVHEAYEGKEYEKVEYFN